MQKKNFCPYCGAKLSSEVRFCPQCGKKLEDDSINNSEEVSQEESIEENIPEQHSSGEIVSDNTPKSRMKEMKLRKNFQMVWMKIHVKLRNRKQPCLLKLL